MKIIRYHTGSSHGLFQLLGLGICSLLAGLNSASGAGSLTPPGPPGPTMKTLQEIEPRTEIPALPFNITAPGSYYLTGHLIGQPGQNGITIYCSDVTLDLNGFALVGTAGSVDGVLIAGTDPWGNPVAHENIVVRNGSVRGWGRQGVEASAAVNVQLSHLQASKNGHTGLSAGSAGSILNCTAFENGVFGLCVRQGSSVAGSRSASNGADGLNAAESCLVHDCVFVYNGDDGVQIGGGSTLVNCVSDQNSYGFYLAGDGISVKNCNAANNTYQGYLGSGRNTKINDSVAQANQDAGIRIGPGSSIVQCSVLQNGGHGIWITEECQVLNNICNGNAIGIWATGYHNRIDSNQAVKNSQFGIRVDGRENVIVRNSVIYTVQSNGAYEMDPNYNHFGKIISAAGEILSQTGWENFSNFILY